MQYNLSELKGIIFIIDEYKWCMEELLKFFELFSSMNVLVSEIKDFSNKVLKELIFVTPFLKCNT